MKTVHTVLPYGRQTIENDDIAAVSAALRSDFLTTGPLVDMFEYDFATAVGAKHAVVCNSGTAALHLAMLAIDCGPGDAVVVPTMTFLATANVVRMTGAEVIFADVDGKTGLLTPETFEQALNRLDGQRIKAALPVHLNGQLCALRDLAASADRRGISIVEDACHALGVPAIGANAHSRVACFSTHPVKAITTGEGGVATTADEALATKMRCLRNHGMTREVATFRNLGLALDENASNPWYYEMHQIGWNYRQPDILCALGISQLKKLDRFRRRRLEIAALYDRLLAPLAPVLRPVPHGEADHGWHIYAILVDFEALGVTRAQFMKELQTHGIATQVHYIPVNRQPYYRERYGNLRMPGADAYYARCLSIPIFVTMTDEDTIFVAEQLTHLVLGSRP